MNLHPPAPISFLGIGLMGKNQIKDLNAAALTLVATGSIAAWSVRHAEKRFKGFGNFARKLPYISIALASAH